MHVFQKYEAIEVCQKSLFHIELTKSVADPEFGFRVEAEIADHYERDDELQVYVSEIKPGGLAHRKGKKHFAQSHSIIFKSFLKFFFIPVYLYTSCE